MKRYIVIVNNGETYAHAKRCNSLLEALEYAKTQVFRPDVSLKLVEIDCSKDTVEFTEEQRQRLIA